jgi:hypothetical protein
MRDWIFVRTNRPQHPSKDVADGIKAAKRLLNAFDFFRLIGKGAQVEGALKDYFAAMIALQPRNILRRSKKDV